MFKMNSKSWFITTLLIGFTQYCFSQQTQDQFADSVQNTFQQLSGKERIAHIANFIVYTNFHENKHEVFKPYLDELYDWEKQHPDTPLLNKIRLGHVNMHIAEYNLVQATTLLYDILHTREPLPIKDSAMVYTFLYSNYCDVGAYSRAWEVLKIRNSILSNHPNDPLLDHFYKIKESDLAQVYQYTKQYEKAVDQFKLFISGLANENEPRYVAGGLNNLGGVYLKMHKPDSAIFSFKQALVSGQREPDSAKHRRMIPGAALAPATRAGHPWPP